MSGSFRLERFCSCGGELIIDSSSLEAIKLGDKGFSELHGGAGHAPATRRQAARARRRQLLRDAERYGREGWFQERDEETRDDRG